MELFVLQNTLKCIVFQAEQKKIIQMCWKEKIQWQSVTNGLGKEHVLRPPFLDKVYYIIFFFLMVTFVSGIQLWISTFPRFVAI
jgi:hypothetical protein